MSRTKAKRLILALGTLTLLGFQAFPQNSPASNQKLQASKKAFKEIGSRWISVGPEVFDAVAAFEFRHVIATREEMKVEIFEGSQKTDLPQLIKWLKSNVGPLLNTRPVDEYQYAEMPSHSLILYRSATHSNDSFLMSIPLAQVFENFGEKEFESLKALFKMKRIR